MIAKVRSRSPNPPTQASAMSARPSRCSAPLSATHRLSSKAACNSGGVPSSDSAAAYSTTPISTPTSG